MLTALDTLSFAHLRLLYALFRGGRIVITELPESERCVRMTARALVQ
jgi:hypothetical protein